MNIESLIRKNIRHLKPYSCARDEFQGVASAYLDANESPYNAPYNRYPDPLQRELKEKIARLKQVRPGQLFLGNGSDEAIDLLIRIFCEPKTDNIVAIEPTYGMYQVCAAINDVEYRRVLLDADFQLNANALLAAVDAHTQLIFLCSPNNPSGNLLSRSEIEKIITHFQGIVIVDEAYIDFAGQPGWLSELNLYPNLVVLQTFSKAWGMAAVRCGMAFASETIISYCNKVKYPYNINLLTQQFIYNQLDNEDQKNIRVQEILEQRQLLTEALKKLPVVEKIYPSDANFLLVQAGDASRIYHYLAQQGVIVRNRHAISLCENCLRITVGTETENRLLIDTWGKFVL